MNTIVIAVCWALFSLAPIAAFGQQQKQTDWAKVHTLTAAAIDSMYSLHFASAEKLCDEVISMAPGDPRGHFFKAIGAYYQYVIARSSDAKNASYDRFMRLTQNVVKVCERLLDKNENDSKSMHYLGGILGYRGLAKFTNDELTSAIWDGKKGFDYLEKAVEIDSTNYDAKMGLGLFNYMISNAPSFVKPALALGGLSGDRIAGLKLLEAAAAKGIYTQTEAKSWLADFYASEENSTRANYHLAAIAKKYPANWWYHQRLGWLLLNQLRKAPEAIEQFALAKECALADNKPASVKNALYQLGVGYFYLGDFEKALQNFRPLLADTTYGFDNAANYYTGLITEIQGNRQEAVTFYKKAGGTGNVPELLKQPMTQYDIAAQKTDNYFRAGRYDDAISTAEATLADPKLPHDDARALLLYTCGRAYYEKGNFAKAQSQYEKALGLSITESPWLLPFASYRCGQACAKAGNTGKAKELFEKALDYDEFPQKEYLQRRVRIELARLK